MFNSVERADKSQTFGDPAMTLRNLLKKRKMGPLSASPLGLTVFCLLVAAFFIYSYGIMRDRAIADEFSELRHFAEPIAIQARWIYEQTGKWPSSLDDPRLGQVVRSPQRYQLQFLQEHGVRVFFNSMNASAKRSMTLRVIVRDNDHYLACESSELPLRQVPRFCRDMGNTKIMGWPP